MTENTNEKELQEERKKIIARLLDIQKRFMDLEREKGVTEKDLHQNPKGILKEYKEAVSYTHLTLPTTPYV